MKITQKKIDGGKVLVSAIASTAEVTKAFNSAHLAFAQQMGLRPERGKTVAQVAEESMGIRDLDSVVSTQAAEALMPFAVDKTGIIPAFPPVIDPKSSLKRGQTFQFEVTITPKPDYKLSSYEPVSITLQPLQIDTSEVDAQLAQMADTYAEYVADDPHPIGKGDSCKIKMSVQRENGEDIPALATEGRTYVAGMGYMPDGFEENVLGMDVGETKTFEFDAPDIDENGKEVTSHLIATVTILEAQKRVQPEINDEWVQKYMPFYKNADDLRKSIEDGVTKKQRQEYENGRRQAVAAAAAKRFEGSIADEVYEAVSQNMMNNLRTQVAAQGMKFDEFVEQQGGQQQFNMMMMLQIREMLVQGYTLDAVFRHEGLTITDEDLNEACAELGQGDPKTVRRQLEESGRGFVLREAAERLRANKWLVEHADIKEPEQDTKAN
ncbi:MAG TPA: trigger factor [Candidatus Aphodovivens excrementavium]|nr:trigger factor [Candidatus Aphodovivens excrementavium]